LANAKFVVPDPFQGILNGAQEFAIFLLEPDCVAASVSREAMSTGCA
jgi:hypothetical protein